MAEFVNACAERDDLGGGRFRETIAIKPIAYLSGGSYYRSNHDWANGDASYPHVITAAPMLVYTAADGMRRICPTRETDRYVEIGAPYVKVGGVWTKPNFGSATRTGNRITWHNPNADMSVTMAGHYIKADIELLGGYVPQDRQFAFPVGLSGLTRTGDTLYREGVPVMRLRKPDLYDAASEDGEHLTIAHEFVSVGGQPYILFTLPAGVTSMSRPVVDPTFEVQPDAAAGKDTHTEAANNGHNFGTATAMGTRQDGGVQNSTLLRFDATSIAGTAVCSAATLYLSKHYTDGTAYSYTYTVHSIASGNAGWIEGTRPGNPALEDEPCHNALASDGAGGVKTAWAGSAGLLTSGTDFEASALGTASANRNDAASTQYTIAVTAGRIQGWFGTPNTNYGLVVRSNANHTTTSNVRSSDHATAADRPKLTVEYTTGSVVPQAFAHYARLRRN